MYNSLLLESRELSRGEEEVVVVGVGRREERSEAASLRDAHLKLALCGTLGRSWMLKTGTSQDVSLSTEIQKLQFLRFSQIGLLKFLCRHFLKLVKKKYSLMTDILFNMLFPH